MSPNEAEIEILQARTSVTTVVTIVVLRYVTQP